MPRLPYLLFGYLLFLLFGALIFYELNAVEEKKRHIRVSNQIKQFIKRNDKCLKEQDLYSYVDYFLDKSHTGLWYSSSSNTKATKWTFGQGLLFVTSLLTTVGYGTTNLITPYGKSLCILYTAVGLALALLLQQILHRRLIPVVYELVFRMAINRYVVYYSTKTRSFFLSYLLVVSLITFVFIIIPTLIIHNLYVPQWTLVELTYFAVTTSHLIGLGDLVPCVDLHGQSRSTCAIVIAVYVISQVLTVSILTHMWFMFLDKSRQFTSQRRHHSDPSVYASDSRKVSIHFNDELSSNVFT